MPRAKKRRTGAQSGRPPKAGPGTASTLSIGILSRRRSFVKPSTSKRDTGGELLHISSVLRMMREVAIARAMRAEDGLGADLSRFVLRRGAAVQAPGTAIGGGR